jgi:hypothetical protein
MDNKLVLGGTCDSLYVITSYITHIYNNQIGNIPTFLVGWWLYLLVKKIINKYIFTLVKGHGRVLFNCQDRGHPTQYPTIIGE